MTKALKILLNIGLVWFLIVIFSAEARAEVGAPKIIKLMSPDFLSLTGTAPARSEVLIYLDGNLVGQTEARSLTKPEAVSVCSGSAAGGVECGSSWYFQYQGTQKLADGSHVVMAVTQDKTSLVLSAPTSEIKFTVNALPAPTLIAPNEKTATADLKPLITGLTRDNSLVKIFIDGAYDGETSLLEDESGTANFAYRPVLDLTRGFHKIYALAQNNAGQTSPKSEVLNFKIELPFPAPTIFQPVVNRQTSLSRPFMVGLAKNDSKIKIYIDKKYHGELTVKNHPSGTANFAFKPVVALARGAHSVYAVAVDKRGKKSGWSNLVNFSTKNSAIAQSAQEERKGVVVKTKEPPKPVEIKSEPAVISKSSGAVLERTGVKPAVEAQGPAVAEEKPASAEAGLEDKEKAIKQELKDKEKAALEKVKSLIGAGAAETKSDRGMINEGKQNQGRLKLSVIIFILFLVGVVAWLLWVNRELVKERRAQTEAEEKAEENKNNPLGGGQDNKLF